MKKTLLSMVGVAVTVLAFGQVTNNAPAAQKVVTSTANAGLTAASSMSSDRVSGANPGTAALGSVLFEEDFSMGLAGQGTNGAWTTTGEDGSGNPVTTGGVWEYRGTATTPDNTVGSRGAYVGTRGPITSATAANGFMIFDSDFLDNAGTAGAFGSGTSPTPHLSWLTSPSFNTVGSMDVSISFTTYFRRYTGDCYVLLSDDGGTTWGDSILVFDTDVASAESMTNETYNVAVNHIANTANAAISFYFDGLINGDGYYFVMVDDIVIAESPDNNLSLDEVYYQTGYDTAYNRYYSSVPTFFTMYDSLQFSANVSNLGGVTQENTMFSNNITYPGGSMTMTSPSVDVMSGMSDSLVIADYFSLDQGIGEYSFAYSVASDSTDDVPANNTIDTVFVNVTDSTYARDFGAIGNYWFGAGATYEIGPLYDIYDTVKATSVSVAVGASSTPNDIISIYIYDASSDLTTPLVSREFIVLDSATIGSLVAYSIPETVLEPGSYFVTVKTYTDEVYFRRSSYEANTGMSVVNTSTGTGWGWTSAVPVVRLNVSQDLFICDLELTANQTGNNMASAVASKGTMPYAYLWSNGETTADITGAPSGVIYTVTVTDDSACTATSSVDMLTSVIENEINGSISLFPSPNNGNFQLNLEGVEAGVYNVSVTNITGQTIYENPINVGGNYIGNISLSNVESGVYFMEIANDKGETSVVKFVVK